MLVGEQEDTFTVHETLICEHAAFFKAACSGDWKEGPTRTVRLSSSSPANFQIYLDWLYSHQQLDLTDLAMKSVEEAGLSCKQKLAENLALHHISKLINLWVMGDYLMDTIFKNRVMDNIIWHELPKRRLVKLHMINRIITNTPRVSGLQRWVIDHTALLVDAAQLQAMREWLPPDVVFELLKKMVSVRVALVGAKSLLPDFESREKYHEQVVL